MNNAAKFREMSEEQLHDQLDQLRTELFNARVGNTTKELHNTSRIKYARRELAQVMTVLNQKKQAGAKA